MSLYLGAISCCCKSKHALAFLCYFKRLKRNTLGSNERRRTTSATIPRCESRTQCDFDAPCAVIILPSLHLYSVQPAWKPHGDNVRFPVIRFSEVTGKGNMTRRRAGVIWCSRPLMLTDGNFRFYRISWYSLSNFVHSAHCSNFTFV